MFPSLLPRRAAPTLKASLRNTALVRGIAHSALRSASVSNASVTTSTKAPPPAEAGEPEKKPLERPAHLAPQVLEAKRALKLAQYQRLLEEKAKREGFSSVDDMVAKEQERKLAAVAKGEATTTTDANASLTPQDAKLADEILKRVEAEAQRKIKSGNFSSGPGIKSLGDILDMTKIDDSTPAETIAQLWTQYHSLKNKLSAVIPARQYADMIVKARQYPNFILPLPRTIVGSLDANETANVAPGERKNGFEMQYMEWGFLPKAAVAADGARDARLSDDDVQAILRAPPATVLFTPLAEYKLRQEYAQPVLILTHFTDLAVSKGVVLLRGEVSEVRNDGSAAPTGIAAAVAASHAGETDAEKLEKLKAPLQSQGKLSQQDAQLLTVMLQRYYLPKAQPSPPPTQGETHRQQLLEAFHGDQERFDLDLLCKVSLEV